MIPHGITLCDSLISTLEHVWQYTGLNSLNSIPAHINLFYKQFCQKIYKFKIVNLCNFCCRWPDILEVDILAILPNSNWLLLKVNVNLQIKF